MESTLEEITLQGFEAICCRQLSAETSITEEGTALISAIAALDIDESCPVARTFS